MENINNKCDCICDFDLGATGYKRPAYLLVNKLNDDGTITSSRLLVENNDESKKLIIPKKVGKLVPLIFTRKNGTKFLGLDLFRNKFLAKIKYDTLPPLFLLGYQYDKTRFPYVFSNWNVLQNSESFNYKLLNIINRQLDEFDSQDYTIKIKTLNELSSKSFLEDKNDYIIIKRGRFLKKIKFENFAYYFRGYTSDGF